MSGLRVSPQSRGRRPALVPCPPVGMKGGGDLREWCMSSEWAGVAPPANTGPWKDKGQEGEAQVQQVTFHPERSTLNLSVGHISDGPLPVQSVIFGSVRTLPGFSAGCPATSTGLSQAVFNAVLFT